MWAEVGSVELSGKHKKLTYPGLRLHLNRGLPDKTRLDRIQSLII